MLAEIELKYYISRLCFDQHGNFPLLLYALAKNMCCAMNPMING